jgi:hypothetical protein
MTGTSSNFDTLFGADTDKGGAQAPPAEGTRIEPDDPFLYVSRDGRRWLLDMSTPIYCTRVIELREDGLKFDSSYHFPLEKMPVWKDEVEGMLEFDALVEAWARNNKIEPKEPEAPVVPPSSPSSISPDDGLLYEAKDGSKWALVKDNTWGRAQELGGKNRSFSFPPSMDIALWKLQVENLIAGKPSTELYGMRMVGGKLVSGPATTVTVM